MILGISGKKQHGKNLLALCLQYHIYCDQMLKKHPTFAYPPQNFIYHITTQPDYSLQKETGWQHKAFATKLKQAASLILGIPVEDFEKEEVKNRVLPPCWDRYFYHDWKGRKHRTDLDIEHEDGVYFREAMTVRRFLQEFGSDACRDMVHYNFWINALMTDYIGTPVDTGENLKFVYPDWIITDCRFINEVDTIKYFNGAIIRINRNIESYDSHKSETALDEYKPDFLVKNDDGIERILHQAYDILDELLIINQNKKQEDEV